MDLRSLRYFVAVAEERHFGRAAGRLHMTQPPLSRAIKQLENDVGALLMHRSPAGVTLTPAGTALYDEARALLEQAGARPGPGHRRRGHGHLHHRDARRRRRGGAAPGRRVPRA